MIGTVAWWITVIGALEVGLINVFGHDFLMPLVGADMIRIFYIIVGIAAVWLLLERLGIVKK